MVRAAPSLAGLQGDAVALEPAGLIEFQRRRKADSRERLLSAAADSFSARGYFPVSVEDIASAAGVSRMTFYRHFGGKAAIAAALFKDSANAATPRFLAIGERDFTSCEVITNWLAELFADDRRKARLIRVFTQANVDDEGFTAQAHGFIRDLVIGLGRSIPAFALDPETESHRRRWIEAWLLVYEILDQSNHAARGSGVAGDPLMLDVLAQRFLAFVRTADPQRR
jgi:AcrR family transcriptional regulator